MSFEVELKAWVQDVEETERAVRACCNYIESYTKVDRYFKAPIAVGEFTRILRIRMESGQAVVTFKDKTIQDGIEVNHEREFEVSDGDLFVELIEQSGFSEFGHKEKTGKRFDYRGTTVEISDVKDLGTFIEVEHIVETDTPQEIEWAQNTIRTVFDLCNGDADRIESSSYLSLLGFKLES